MTQKQTIYTELNHTKSLRILKWQILIIKFGQFCQIWQFGGFVKNLIPTGLPRLVSFILSVRVHICTTFYTYMNPTKKKEREKKEEKIMTSGSISQTWFIQHNM